MGKPRAVKAAAAAPDAKNDDKQAEAEAPKAPPDYGFVVREMLEGKRQPQNPAVVGVLETVKKNLAEQDAVRQNLDGLQKQLIENQRKLDQLAGAIDNSVGIIKQLEDAAAAA